MSAQRPTKPQSVKILRKRETMKAKVLAAAAVQMNQRGAASLDLKALSDTVGLSRNSLYYYFKDRRDLVYRCYLKAAEDLKEDIERSLTLTGDNRSQLEHFLRTTLINRTHETAVLSDLGLLDRDQRSEVQRLQACNLDTLEEMFRNSISAGDLRPNNPEIASRVLLGVINWARLWFRWTGHYRSGTSLYLAKVADDIIDGLLYGISARRDYSDKQPLKLQIVTAPDFDAFDVRSIGEEKRLQLIGGASRVFNRKGIAATSIDDIAMEIGVTKGAIYHYFADKEQLLWACYERAFDLYDLFNQAGESRGEGTLLALATPLHLNCQAQASRHPPLIFQSGLAQVPQNISNRAQASSSKLHKTYQKAVERGECRREGSVLIDLSPGSFFWLQRWLPQSADQTIETLADDICHIIVNGVAA